jgi:hypothetical protein
VRRIFTDRNTDLWVEFPPDSGELIKLHDPTLSRVADRFGTDTLAEAEEALGPLTEITPREK